MEEMKEFLGSYLSEEPCDQVSKYDSLICLVVVSWRRNAGSRPEISLPLVELVVSATSIEQKDSGSTINQPSTV